MSWRRVAMDNDDGEVGFRENLVGVLEREGKGIEVVRVKYKEEEEEGEREIVDSKLPTIIPPADVVVVATQAIAVVFFSPEKINVLL